MRCPIVRLGALLLVALWPYHLAAQGTIAPELPRSIPSAAIPVPSRILRVAAGGNFQTALDSARSGDAIELARGATYAGQFILPAKPCTAGIVVRPAPGAALPSSGTRITPALAAALELPRIRATTNGYAIATALGACRWYLVGLDIGVDSSITQSYGLVGLGDAGQLGQKTLAQVAHDLVLSQVYVHGRPELPLRRCIALNSASTAIVDSWISECHDAGSDAQAIGGWNGPGPYLIRNTHLEGSGQAIMFGGADAASAELSPADITIDHNYPVKPIAWKGGPWLIKTIIELKNAKRVLIEANVIEGNWPQAWDGTTVTIKSVNQDGSAPWSGTTDVTMRRNLIRHTGAGINIHSDPERPKPSVLVARVAITDNLILGLNSPDYPGIGKAFFLGGHIADLRIEHNTVTWSRGGLAVAYEGEPPEPFLRHRVANNLFATIGGIGLTGQALGYPAPVWAAWAPDGVMTGNVFAAGVAFATGWWNTYPAGNRLLVNDDSTFAPVGFAADWSLAPSSALRGAGTDGKDPGADVAAVLAATAGVIEGTPGGVVPPPAPVPVPTPALPSITAAQLRSAVTAIDRVVSASGRENAATKAALAPVAVYLHALLGATP